MTLFKRLRWEYEHGVGTIRGVAQKYGVHRRTVRAALKSPVPPKRKVYRRERPKMAPLIPFIDGILETNLETSRPHRPTAHQIWTRIRTEIPGRTYRSRRSGLTCRRKKLSWIPSKNELRNLRQP